jgi:16S rRNA (uracil1498-N3)-methyltransferase
VRPRFHVPGSHAATERIALPEDEAEHLVRVLRMGVGDEVEIFDGAGALWRAEVVHVGKKSASVRRLEALEPARELSTAITLVLSVLKGDKNDDVVRDAVMLGAARITPVISERCEVGLAAITRSNRVARWQRIAVASAKQCGRAVVPPVDAAVTLERYWSQKPGGARIVCVEPSAVRGGVVFVQGIPKTAAVDLIVGPEGGWGDAEIAAAQDGGAMLMSLGSRTLRADAVPIIAMTALLTTWGDLT